MIKTNITRFLSVLDQIKVHLGMREKKGLFQDEHTEQKNNKSKMEKPAKVEMTRSRVADLPNQSREHPVKF